MRPCAYPLAVALAVSGVAAHAAADVTVRITDREGQALANVAVRLTLVESHTPRPPWLMIPTQTTGLDGQATFPRLEPGVYATSISGLTDPFLISPPSFGTESSQGRFTVRNEPRLTVPIVLSRGDQVNVEFTYDIPAEPSFVFSFVELATGMRVGQTLNRATRAKVLLPAGRWRVEFKSPPGLVFRSLEFDGVTAPLASDTLEITEGGRQRFVTIAFTGPCQVRVHVSTSGGDGVAPSVSATQTAPGPLSMAATAVGAPPLSPFWIPREAPGSPYFHGGLPDGTLRIAPLDDALESSDPPFIDVNCAGGEQYALDFTTRLRSGDDGARKDMLTVDVLDPDGNDVDDAVVEVYPQDSVEGDGEPIARSRTGGTPGNSGAVFTGLPRKPLVVVAGHVKWIDASVVVPAAEDAKQNPRYRTATVRLGAGATVEVDAQKPDGTVAAGVSLALDRDKPAAGARTGAARRVRDEALRERKAHPGARTDATGRARITGIEPGRYVARGAYAGSGEGTYLVQVRQGSQEPADTLSLQFEGNESIGVTVVLRAAASVVADLVCDDGGALPLRVDARLLAPDRDATWRTTLPVGELVDPLSKLDARAIGGPSANRLRLGPLKPGEYCLAIRPAGFDRWAFAGSGDDPTRAMTLQLRQGQELDLSVWTIPCRSSLLLTPRPIGDATTDVSHATVLSTIAASEVRVDRETAKRRSYRALEPQPLLHAMRLYGVPNEPVTVALQVRDRFLLPEPVSPLPNPLALDLARGREELVPLQFEALAGSMDIAVDAPAARATFADGTITPIARDPKAGLLRAGALRPGVYSVDVCADAGCSRVVRHFGDVTVTALSVTVLPAAP